jgi:transposase
MAIADSHGLPIAVCTESASPAEVKFVKQTIAARFIPEPPQRLIGDKAYDSDGLDEQMLNEFGTEVIAPHRQGRRPDRKTQDARPLRRFCRRWKVERMFSWMYNFRRLVVRWEYHVENYLGFVQLACAMILIRYL